MSSFHKNCFLKILLVLKMLIISCHLCLDLPSGLSLGVLQSKFCEQFLFSPNVHTWIANALHPSQHNTSAHLRSWPWHIWYIHPDAIAPVEFLSCLLKEVCYLYHHPHHLMKNTVRKYGQQYHIYFCSHLMKAVQAEQAKVAHSFQTAGEHTNKLPSCTMQWLQPHSMTDLFCGKVKCW